MKNKMDSLTQKLIDQPSPVFPAEYYVKNKERDFSNSKFYIRWRRNRAPFFVIDETLEAAFGSMVLSLAGLCLLLLLS